jgi:anti-sigma-K factor RskA
MTERDDIDMLAAEYVLGTLDRAERDAVAARRPNEPALEAAIADWQGRLASLDEYAQERAPAADLFAKIEERLDGAPATDGSGAEVVALRTRLARWRTTAVAASLIAASLAGVVVYQAWITNGWLTPQAQNTYVAVFNEGDQRPRFLLSVDLDTRRLTIRPLAGGAPSGKSYELWIVSERYGPQPKSLGLLDRAEGPTQKRLSDLSPALLREATFGISLEPEGGSPIGRPTGPAIHGRLIPTAE